MNISRSAEETIAIGRTIGETAQAGEVFALVGDLGSGKTQLAKGIAAALRSPAEITSPTFTLLHEYRGGRMPIYHFDFYRLDTVDEAARLGLDDYFYGDGLCVVEWADRFPELLPDGTRWFSITIGDGDARSIVEGRR